MYHICVQSDVRCIVLKAKPNYSHHSLYLCDSLYNSNVWLYNEIHLIAPKIYVYNTFSESMSFPIALYFVRRKAVKYAE